MADGAIYAVGDNTPLEVLSAVLPSSGEVISTTTFPIDFMNNCRNAQPANTEAPDRNQRLPGLPHRCRAVQRRDSQ